MNTRLVSRNTNWHRKCGQNERWSVHMMLGLNNWGRGEGRLMGINVMNTSERLSVHVHVHVHVCVWWFRCARDSFFTCFAVVCLSHTCPFVCHKSQTGLSGVYSEQNSMGRVYLGESGHFICHRHCMTLAFDIAAK